MATPAHTVLQVQRPWLWFWHFLKQELAPYPGRGETVARMAIAASLIMIVCMTFRLSYAWQGAIYALFVSREDFRSTLKSSGSILLVTAIAAAYILVSIPFVVNVPVLHFFWVMGTLFVAFFVISAQTNYLAAVAFVNTISAGIPLWDRHVAAETNVEDTLRLCLATSLAFAITAAVELVFTRLRPADAIVLQVADRLSAVENLLICYAEGRALDPAIEQRVIRLEMVGTSMLLRILRRSTRSRQYSQYTAGVAGLAGRLVNLAAALTQLRFEPSANDQRRFGELASKLASIRNDLLNGRIPGAIQFDTNERSGAGVPLLAEMEYTVTLIPQVLAASQSSLGYLPSAADLPRPALLVPGPLLNPEHLHFALKGCLAAGSCYVIYSAIDWPEISTAVTTSLLTALSTIGASRQKQILRIAGASAGGFLLGMGSQIFILPSVDSIAGFTVLFVFVTALCSWVLTSSARLSYFGVQAALAFYLVHLQGFKIETSLEIARDRVLGTILGLLMMWLVFDQLWGTTAAVAMKSASVSNFRLLAQLTREPVSNDLRAAIKNGFALRERINSQLDSVRSLADSVLFEFGPSRLRDLQMRDRVRRLQPQLRALFLLRVASFSYRLQLPGFELPETVRACQREYDERSAQMLDEIADEIEGKPIQVKVAGESSSELLRRVLQTCSGPESTQLPAGRVESFLTLLESIDQLTASLARAIATDFRSG